jgi:hypothetical protein
VNRLDQVGEISRHAQAWRIPATTRDLTVTIGKLGSTIHTPKPHLFLQWARHLTGTVILAAGYGELHAEGHLINGLPVHITCPFTCTSWRVLCLGELEQLITRKAAA